MKKAEILKALTAGTTLVRDGAARLDRGTRIGDKDIVVVIAEIKQGMLKTAFDAKYGDDVGSVPTSAGWGTKSRVSKSGWLIETVAPEGDAQTYAYADGMLGRSDRRRWFTSSALLVGTMDDDGQRATAAYSDHLRLEGGLANWADELELDLGHAKLNVWADGERLYINTDNRYSRAGDIRSTRADLVIDSLPHDAEVRVDFTVGKGMSSDAVAELAIEAPEGEVFGEPELAGRMRDYIRAGMVRSSVVVEGDAVIRETLRRFAASDISPTD